MARRHHYRRRLSEATELDVTTFLNLMVVLVPFLLITAVFSQVTIVELDMPTSSGNSQPVEPDFRVEVMVREEGLEIGNGTAVIAQIPKVDDEYDLATLADYVLDLKREHPDHTKASVLLEPEIPYDYLIQVMDIVRSVEIRDDTAALVAEIEAESPQPEAPEGVLLAQQTAPPSRLELFPQISVGEAP
jgi:biopolymer transport protein ExbD